VIKLTCPIFYLVDKSSPDLTVVPDGLTVGHVSLDPAKWTFLAVHGNTWITGIRSES